MPMRTLRPPTPGELARARARVGYAKIRVGADGRVVLTEPGVSIDLGELHFRSPITACCCNVLSIRAEGDAAYLGIMIRQSEYLFA